jgi:nicotinic acid mononucleotide adenylyltransferase
MELAQAALPLVHEVVFVLPRILPHKEYVGATFAERVEMLRAAAAEHPRFSIAVTERGLFTEIAQDCHSAYGGDVRLSFLCGRDAAERIVGWDYGRPAALVEMLRQFDLLVASRDGEYAPPPEFAHAVNPLLLSGEFSHVSATEVRTRISRQEAWEHLVPPSVHPYVQKFYS